MANTTPINQHHADALQVLERLRVTSQRGGADGYHFLRASLECARFAEAQEGQTETKIEQTIRALFKVAPGAIQEGMKQAAATLKPSGEAFHLAELRVVLDTQLDQGWILLGAEPMVSFSLACGPHMAEAVGLVAPTRLPRVEQIDGEPVLFYATEGEGVGSLPVAAAVGVLEAAPDGGALVWVTRDVPMGFEPIRMLHSINELSPVLGPYVGLAFGAGPQDDSAEGRGGVLWDPIEAEVSSSPGTALGELFGLRAEVFPSGLPVGVALATTDAKLIRAHGLEPDGETTLGALLHRALVEKIDSGDIWRRPSHDPYYTSDVPAHVMDLPQAEWRDGVPYVLLQGRRRGNLRWVRVDAVQDVSPLEPHGARVLIFEDGSEEDEVFLAVQDSEAVLRAIDRVMSAQVSVVSVGGVDVLPMTLVNGSPTVISMAALATAGLTQSDRHTSIYLAPPYDAGAWAFRVRQRAADIEAAVAAWQGRDSAPEPTEGADVPAAADDAAPDDAAPNPGASAAEEE